MITPFYIGQKVVALSDGEIRRKGKIYPVTGLHNTCKCGLFLELDYITGNLSADSGEIVSAGQVYKCGDCDTLCVYNGLIPFMTRDFAPVQETGLPLISLSKIIEKERDKEFEPANFEPQILAEN